MDTKEQKHHTDTQTYTKARDNLEAVRSEVKKVIVGQSVLVDRMLIALMCNGHMILEGVPGLAKTTAIATLATALDLDFKRIQFTPDLLPSDLIGNRIYNQNTGEFSVKKGPVFANFVLADEINRAPAKVQSALLESMQEHQVTIGEETYSLPDPFFVMATQNPIEQEGTYSLPEAQTDRFLLKTIVQYPTDTEELLIMEHAFTAKDAVKAVANKADLQQIQDSVESVFVDDSIKHYIIAIVRATRHPAKYIDKKHAPLFAFGASPRASIGLYNASKAVAFLQGREYVVPEDIKEIAPDVLRHRIIPTYEAEAEDVTQDDLVAIVLEHIQVP